MKSTPKQLEYWRNYRKANRDKYKAYLKTVRSKKASQFKEWCKKNRDKRKASDLKYRKAHPEIVARRRRDYYLKNLDSIREKSKQYRSKNRERLCAKLKKYYKKRYSEDSSFRNAFALAANKRRAMRQNATINAESVKMFVQNAKAKKHFKCYYCEKRFSIKHLHLDHIIALSKGGAHAVENLCTSCSNCNLSKHNKPIQEWIKLGQQILAL